MCLQPMPMRTEPLPVRMLRCFCSTLQNGKMCIRDRHITEEIWQQQALSEQPIYRSQWPSYDEKAMEQQETEIAVQICGKIKMKLMVPSSYGKEETERFVLENDAVKALIAGREARKIIAVPGRRCV